MYFLLIIIIYRDVFPSPRRGSHVKSDNTHNHPTWGGGVDDFSFFDCSSPFDFLLIDFIVLFLFLLKYYNIMFIIIVFRLVIDELFSRFLLDFFCSLPRDQSRDATPRFWGSVILYWFFISRSCIFFPATIVMTM